jgi:hypothetical protein
MVLGWRTATLLSSEVVSSTIRRLGLVTVSCVSSRGARGHSRLLLTKDGRSRGVVGNGLQEMYQHVVHIE